MLDKTITWRRAQKKQLSPRGCHVKVLEHTCGSLPVFSWWTHSRENPSLETLRLLNLHLQHPGGHRLWNNRRWMYDYCHLKHTTKKLRRGQKKTEKQQNECREHHAHNLLLIQVASCNPVGPRSLVVLSQLLVAKGRRRTKRNKTARKWTVASSARSVQLTLLSNSPRGIWCQVLTHRSSTHVQARKWTVSWPSPFAYRQAADKPAAGCLNDLESSW